MMAAQGRMVDWLARQVGVHPSLISHAIAGRRTVGEATANRVAMVLGVPLFFAFELTDGSKSVPDSQSVLVGEVA